ncbi:Ir7c [Drosophila busckii]|uniref:Ir7c n=1 Tax=Drosophila busckii TaxID=30019 RepID=A0A0M4FAE0_DROBS|nr:uncharacterized protein LOC108606024 [Drosophila busckii]ALC49725.1 Ir7c [Drosophila busckii]
MLGTESLQTVYNMSMMYAMVWTINRHYASDSSNPLTIAQFATWETSRSYHNDLIDAALQLASGAARIKFLTEGERLDESHADEEPEPAPLSGLNGRDTAIWLLDSLRAYKRLERHLLLPRSWYKRNGFYCIVYTGAERGRIQTIKEIFRRLLDIYVINVNVFLVERLNGTVQVFNYYPYQPHRCQSHQPVHYATFEGSLGTDPTLHAPYRWRFFDTKLDDMHGCELITVTFEHRPFVMIDRSPTELTDGERLHGIEGMIFRLMAERMNFTIKLIEQVDHDRGVVLPNGTTTGAMSKIVGGSANITFACFMYNKERSENMLPSISYTSFPIVLCVPGGQPMSPLQRLINPLGDKTWMCLLICLALGFGIIAAMRLYGTRRQRDFVLGESNRVACLVFWMTLLGGLHMQPPRRNFARYLLTLWLLLALVLRAAYTGEMYLLLQDGRVREPLTTLAEVLAKQYMFHLIPAMQPLFRDLLPVMHYKLEDFYERSLVRLRDDEHAQIVVPLIEPSVAIFNLNSGVERPGLTVLPQPLVTAPLTIYMRPHSFLKQRMDSLIINMMSSGLVQRYRHMYLDRIEFPGRRKRSKEPTKLSLWQLGGVLASYLMLLLLATLIFLLEIAAAAPERRRLRRLMDAANRYVA